MTAEIAVLNRSAVALAADSVVTIGHGSNAKTYASENKLFELSEKKPVGLMIYNSLDFYGYPWEVLIKDFRKEKGSTACESVCDWTQCFVDWLDVKHRPTEDQQESQFTRNVREILQEPVSKVRGKSIPFLTRRRTKALQQRIRDILPEVIREETRALIDYGSISTVNKLKAADPNHARILDETTLQTWLSDRAALIDQIAAEQFGNYPLDDADKRTLRQYVLDVFSRHVFTSSHTGLVFAGFGDSEQFPSLHNVTIDGVLGGSLRCLEGDYYDVDRSENQGTVIPFAQPDVARRFLYGVDDILEDQVAHYFVSAIKDLAPHISSSLGLGGERRKALKQALEIAADSLKQSYFGSASDDLKNHFFWSIEDMVRLMPKQEMANLAEALVNITIIKRRASAELETVGGPIDVAVISRHEGFVWVKRKHYFDPRLNPRFFWRKFGVGNHDSEAEA
ncbi:hypothetical protein [Bradyrhizobium sp. NAS96.2]|uniref:hypothetical protein n=1 Tax=Bradyrhizobium sp. NAS96.2 TaxID=1680160 RepID=UPI00093BD01F|nr:hypothetical protein [Bradyrhizobium sp. NAS96.2]OKO72135.1 hypothetical protein AC628_26890 [Bradyrhizobium sp. NAS96.2]